MMAFSATKEGRNDDLGGTLRTNITLVKECKWKWFMVFVCFSILFLRQLIRANKYRPGSTATWCLSRVFDGLHQQFQGRYFLSSTEPNKGFTDRV